VYGCRIDGRLLKLTLLCEGDLTTLEVAVVSEINECFLLHGTKRDTVDVVANQGLDSRLAVSVYFGKGVYFAESSTKSDQYAGECACSSSKHRVLQYYTANY